MIVLFNRNLPTRCHKTSFKVLCAYSIGAPIGAGLISREKHHDPLVLVFYLNLDFLCIQTGLAPNWV